MAPPELVQLLLTLKKLAYSFTTVTPDTHQLVNARPGNRDARNIQDVFGWNRPFRPRALPSELFELARAAGACRPDPGTELWRATLRVSTVAGELYVHSAFPTLEEDAVFLGPDTYRFVRALLATARPARCAVDVGTGTGAAGISLARRGLLLEPVVLADVNERALAAARVNAEVAGVRAEVVKSDVLAEVPAHVDLIVANPPYMRDAASRTYRDGGGNYGEALAARIVREALERLAGGKHGGTLLLYTGAAIVAGHDTFLAAIEPDLRRAQAAFSYEELDPDVFGSELERPAYADVDRIAAVFLQARLQ